jgi:hypothetical protein
MYYRNYIHLPSIEAATNPNHALAVAEPRGNFNAPHNPSSTHSPTSTEARLQASNVTH